jgi:hypothetical protein
MADPGKRTTQLDPASLPLAATDLLGVVQDVGGTPVTKKIAKSDLASELGAEFAVDGASALTLDVVNGDYLLGLDRTILATAEVKGVATATYSPIQTDTGKILVFSHTDATLTVTLPVLDVGTTIWLYPNNVGTRVGYVAGANVQIVTPDNKQAVGASRGLVRATAAFAAFGVTFWHLSGDLLDVGDRVRVDIPTLAFDTLVYHQNSTAEASQLTAPVATAANYLKVGDMVTFDLAGAIKNTTGSSANITLRIKAGTTVVFSIVFAHPGSGGTRNFTLRGGIRLFTFTGTRTSGLATFETSIGDGTAISAVRSVATADVVDLATAINWDFTSQMSTASADIGVLSRSAVFNVIRRT